MRWLWGLIAGVVGVRILGAALVPLVPDEAYYMQWARHLAWGYFDHPPGVALLARTAVWSGFGSVFWARSATVACACLLMPITLRLLRTLGLNSQKQKCAAVALSSFNICGLMFGILTTPDTLLMIAWAYALTEAARALSGDDRAWLRVGAGVGFGMLSKYMMVLFYPVLLIAVLLSQKRQFKNPWFYAGGFLSVLVFSPHIFWNAQNDWVSIKFQLRHGLENSHVISMAAVTDLPAAEKVTEPDSIEFKYKDYFFDPALVEAPKRKKSEAEKMFVRVSEFLGSQILLWGFLLVPLCVGLYRRRSLTIPDLYRPLLYAGTLVPLVVFGLISFKSKIEANWPSFYMFSASILLADLLAAKLRHIAIGAGLNVALLIASIAFTSSSTSMDKNFMRKSRLIKETHGYEQLAEWLHAAPEPLLVETYQLKAMLNFFNPDQAITQYPGITRWSEFNRASYWYAHHLKDLQDKQGFWLVTHEQLPRRVEGFQIQAMEEIRACLGEDIKIREADFSRIYVPPCGKNTVRRWFLVHYVLNIPPTEDKVFR